jgi:hypothetical protein
MRLHGVFGAALAFLASALYYNVSYICILVMILENYAVTFFTLALGLPSQAKRRTDDINSHHFTVYSAQRHYAACSLTIRRN